MIVRGRLERQARQDAEVAASGSRSGDESAEPSTPTVQAIQAHANAYARREEQRFFSDIHRELAEHRILTKALDADLASYEEKTDNLSAAERDAIAEGQGPAFEELRRLERRIKRGHRRADELTALIHSRFTTAKLRAGRYYDYSDEKIAVYWGAFRRSASTERLGDRAPGLRRLEWLNTKENTKLLELWQGRTDVQA
ncbi:hypothetical protein [Leifsonia poae]|uniref:Uncharacterized protein n=1 Tax=Leifsonia poae TaxID=110933 RepID=A0A9W6HB06_9MICO|nr:hypothetical protein [Leifsonia poae]GLJ77224.1 hypothetical protein GCM10017584_27980 [Leifsonia poae]